MEIINNHKFYKKAYKKHGIDAKGVHWYNSRTQFKRFEVLINAIKKELAESSLLDIGCGFAHLLDYLKERKIYPKTYLGVDKEEFFIELCKMRYESYSFSSCDILKDEIPQYDFLVCSGALNLFDRVDFLKAIEKCYKASNKGFVFNFLVQDSIHQLFKDEVIDYCNTLCVDLVVFDNYLENDCTIHMTK